jgi:hypothetical protein
MRNPHPNKVITYKPVANFRVVLLKEFQESQTCGCHTIWFSIFYKTKQTMFFHVSQPQLLTFHMFFFQAQPTKRFRKASIDRRFTESLIQWFIDSRLLSFIDSVWFCDILVQWISCAWIISCHFIRISTSISSFVYAAHTFNNLLFLHRKNCPTGHWNNLYPVFSKRPAGRALPDLVYTLW